MDVTSKVVGQWLFWLTIGVLGLAILGGAIYLAVVILPGTGGDPQARSMEIVNLWQPILAMVFMLIIIGLLAGSYAAFRLSGHPFALGLPRGSIRAILALGFIVIFTAVSILLLSDELIKTEYEKVGSVQGLTKAEYQSYVAELAEGFQFAPMPKRDGAGALSYDGDLYRLTASKDGLDIAKQILTALITALSVVTGFYFGSRTASPPTEDKGSETIGEKTPGEQAADGVAKIETMVGTIATFEAQIRERINAVQDGDIKELVTMEHEEITNQQAAAEEALARAKKLQVEIAKETDPPKLATAQEALAAAMETAERALEQAQAALTRVEEILTEPEGTSG